MGEARSTFLASVGNKQENVENRKTTLFEVLNPKRDCRDIDMVTTLG